MSVGKFKTGDKVRFFPERSISNIWKKLGKVDTKWIEEKQNTNGFIIISKLCSGDIHLQGCQTNYHYPEELFELYNAINTYELW